MINRFIIIIIILLLKEQNEVTLENCEDVHAVGCLLKLYLRELPEPLLTFRFYDTFLSIQSNYNDPHPPT